MDGLIYIIKYSQGRGEKLLLYTLHAVPELNREMLTFNLEEMLKERVFLCAGLCCAMQQRRKGKEQHCDYVV